MRNADLWWDFVYLLEDAAERLLNVAALHRSKGNAVGSDDIADEMEECAWAMLSVDMDDEEKNAENIEKFTTILKNVRNWWD